RVADLQFRMADLAAGPRHAHHGLGAQRLLVELDRLLRAADHQVRRDGVEPCGYRTDANLAHCFSLSSKPSGTLFLSTARRGSAAVMVVKFRRGISDCHSKVNAGMRRVGVYSPLNKCQYQLGKSRRLECLPPRGGSNNHIRKKATPADLQDDGAGCSDCDESAGPQRPMR